MYYDLFQKIKQYEACYPDKLDSLTLIELNKMTFNGTCLSPQKKTHPKPFPYPSDEKQILR